jgi:sigma-B regulation protein RsbU (phosphoserine phosphatase)
METNHNNSLAEKLEMTGTLVDNLTEQLRMAGLVQRDFLPVRLPNTDRLKWAVTFLPVEWVSGDIYDVARLDEQYIGFYVADVVGHAMPAALLTIFLKQALVMRETIGNDYRIFSPSYVMQGLNTRFTEQRLSGYQFATCCYCLLNIQTLQVTFTRAGHPYPVLIRPGQNPSQLEVPGPLLGIFDHSEYPEQTIQLQPGDKLLLYSDGAEPFIGAFDEITGFNFSKEFMSIKDLPADQMLSRFNTLVKSRKLAPSEVDDITAVVLEVS